MTKMEYAQEIVNIIGGEAKEVVKANGVVKIGISRTVEGINVAPTVYLDDIYDEDMPVELAAQKVDKALIENTPKGNMDMSFIYNYENVKPMLRARLYNKATPAEVFKSAKVYGFEDLIVVPYIVLNSFQGGQGGIKVTKALVKTWGIKSSEVIKDAINNSKSEIRIESMFDVLKALQPNTPEELLRMTTPDTMYVISNPDRCFGAISAALAKIKLKKVFPKGYVILPSSVHEVIVVAADSGEAQMFTSMVQEVNASEVLPEEVLSNRAYFFPIKKKEVA